MHRQIAADAVAGAVVEIEARLPQRGARQRIELRAADAFREHRAGDGDVALEHAGETVAHFVARRADRDGAGDVSGAVLVLRAGIDQEQFVQLKRAVGGAGDAVMHDCRVRPGAGDGRKRNVLERAAVAAEAFQRLHGVDLAQFSRWRLRVEPGQEARHRHAVAQMRGARARDLGLVLRSLHQRDRVGAAHKLAAGLRQQPRQRVGGAGLVEPHHFVLERAQVADEIVRRAHGGEILQRVARFVVELGGLDIERRAAFARHNGKGQHQRRMRHVGAADVEGPGHVLRIRHHQHIGAQFDEFGADARELVGGALAGEVEVAQRHASRRRGRALAPQPIDRVAVDRHQFGAGRGAGAAQSVGILGRVQPGIVAELGAALEIWLEPSLGRVVHQMRDGENTGVDLVGRLHGIAAVDEQRGALVEHDRRPGRAGKAGEPSQPLLAGRQIFVLLAVGARHDETIKSAPLQLGAQGSDACRRRRALARIVEGLEAGLEHGRHSNVLCSPGNAGMRPRAGGSCITPPRNFRTAPAPYSATNRRFDP